MSQSGNNTSSSTSTVSVTQVLSVPIGKNLATPLTRTLIPSPGSIAFDSVAQKLFVGTATGWQQVTSV
jgi:hypothetical protein